MNRLKLIVLSSALSLITVGVFAGKEKFVNYLLYYGDGTNFTQITSTFTTLTDFNTSTGNDISVTTSTGSKGLYVSTNGGTTKNRLKTSSF